MGALDKKARAVASDTRTWTSGAVRFVVITIEGHPEESYIKFEKNLFGRSGQSEGVQRFNLRLHDWRNLKRLIEEELPEKHQWVLDAARIKFLPVDNAGVLSFIEEHPDLIEKVLDLPALGSLSRQSFEALNRMALRVYEVQKENIDAILAKVAVAGVEEFVQFAALLRDMRLGQITALANLVRQKLQIIDLLERLIQSPDTLEREIHSLLENNTWIADKRYEILASDEQLAGFLRENLKDDPELGKRPDLIVKRVPHREELILIELKRPAVALQPVHIGQVLEYKEIIRSYRPNWLIVDCFLFGLRKHQHFAGESRDVRIATYGELIVSLRDEYGEYLKVLETTSEEVAAEDT